MDEIIPITVNAVTSFKNVIKDLSEKIGKQSDDIDLKNKNGLLLSEMNKAKDTDSIYYKFGVVFDVIQKNTDIVNFEFNLWNKGRIQLIKFPIIPHTKIVDVLIKVRTSLDLIVEEFSIYSILKQVNIKNSDKFFTAKEFEIRFGTKFMLRTKINIEKPVGLIYKLRIQMVESSKRQEIIRPVLGKTVFQNFLQKFCKSRNINIRGLKVSVPLEKPLEKSNYLLTVENLCLRFGNTFELYESVSTEKMNEFNLSMKIIKHLIDAMNFKKAMEELDDLLQQFPKNEFPDHHRVLESKIKLIRIFDRIEKIFNQNPKIHFEHIQSTVGISKDALLGLMMEWSNIFVNYRIEGEYIIKTIQTVNLNGQDQHLTSVDHQFDDWEINERTKDGKI
jgi:hypothetical protein